MAAWILVDSSALPHLLFSGICMVMGPLDSVNAYWAELQGIHALLVALEYFCAERQITLGGITIGCDNQGALKQTQQFHKQVMCAHPHTDLIQAITVLHLCSKFLLTFQYVPGHQDALSKFKDLSLLSASMFGLISWPSKNSTGWCPFQLTCPPVTHRQD